eukprot:153959-Rhodomonas_salina.2
MVLYPAAMGAMDVMGVCQNGSLSGGGRQVTALGRASKDGKGLRSTSRVMLWNITAQWVSASHLSVSVYVFVSRSVHPYFYPSICLSTSFCSLARLLGVSALLSALDFTAPCKQPAVLRALYTPRSTAVCQGLPVGSHSSTSLCMMQCTNVSWIKCHGCSAVVSHKECAGVGWVQPLASVRVGPSSPLSSGYAWEYLSSSVRTLPLFSPSAIDSSPRRSPPATVLLLKFIRFHPPFLAPFSSELAECVVNLDAIPDFPSQEQRRSSHVPARRSANPSLLHSIARANPSPHGLQSSLLQSR